jgi:DNA repair photolyase
VQSVLAEKPSKSVRSDTARASAVRDPAAAREAAFKAWRTMREQKRVKTAKGMVSLVEFAGESLTLPPGVASGTYKIRAPLIKPSKLTYVDKGGVGKELSDGWVINYSIGCIMGCRFCYVDSIHKKFSFTRVGNIVYNDWGNYFAVPENLDDAIEETKWEKWKGIEVMMSSTHDPYLAQLHKAARKILEHALPAGVKICIQTRSPLVERDFGLIADYRDQVRLQVSIATYDSALSRLVETRVVPPQRRMETLRKAKDAGLRTGVIIAPVFPPVSVRRNLEADLEAIIADLEKIQPDYIYGESVHIRGINLAYVENALGEKVDISGFDRKAEKLFREILSDHGLRGRWWVEH